MKLSSAKEIIGGSLGFPSKMPGTSYGLPATACLAGARLAKVKGSICSECYALKDFYRTPNSAKAQLRRLASITDPLWVEAMVTVLAHVHAKPTIRVDLGEVGVRLQRAGGSRYRYNESGWHRWHDSGDLQSIWHLEKIIEVCRRTPQIRHWLPTRETSILRWYKGDIPPNLVIRVSATMIGGPPPVATHSSTVHWVSPPLGAHECPAPRQEHKCGQCRACWSRDVRVVSYRKH